MTERVFIASAVRTAIGSFGGSLVGVSPAELGTVCAKEALQRAKVGASGTESIVGEVILGNVLGAGHGMNLARQIQIGCGLPVQTPAFTVNKVCGSGLKAVGLAYREISSGGYEAALAGGVESMSQAPHVSLSARWGARLGAAEMKDLILSDGLTDIFKQYHMGVTAENLAKRYGITRQEQDAFACESQRRAAAAQARGDFKEEIVAVPLMKRGKVVGSFEVDEFVRTDCTMEALAKLSPAFQKDGTVTAGNASGINDGAAMLVLMTESACKRSGVQPLAEILGFASSGVEPEIMGVGPVGAVRKLCANTQIPLEQVELIEANEAFAVQALAVARDLELDAQKVNVSGGAISLGHPIGASGARILVTLCHGLKRLGRTIGIATLCVGGGQGVAMMVRRVG